MSKYKLPPNFPKGFIALKEMEHIGARVKPEVYEKWQKLLFMPDGYEQRKLQFKTSDGKVNNSDLMEYMIENLYEEVFGGEDE